MDSLEDFESFMKKVDKISEMVKDLNSSEIEVHQKAVEEADCYIAALEEPCRTKVNKTTINTNPPFQASWGPQTESPENFMKHMEKDAEDRRKRRIVKEKRASALKDKGNEAYAQEDYESAVKYYSEGLAELRDMGHLYTNRAQAYIKLGRYKEAINDCEWALKCNERSTKAYLHMGKAYLALKKYDDSRTVFGKIVEIEPGREKMMKEYLTKVDLEEKKEQEMNARQEFDKGVGKATMVPELLKKLSKPRQMPVYYCGGLAILSQALTHCTGRTLFRLNSGFSIISSNDTIRRCLLEERKDPYSQDLCASVLNIWRIICCENDENQKMLMACPVFRLSVVHLVPSEDVTIQTECLALLCLYSQSPHGRLLAIDNLDISMLTRNLMACISQLNMQQETTAVNILENFAAEKKFRIQLRDVLTHSVIVPFTSALRNVSKSNQHIFPSLLSAIGCLAQDDVICHNLAHDPRSWEAFLAVIKQCSTCGYREILYPVLGLIINLSTIMSSVSQEHAVSLSGCCLGLLRDCDGGIITRAIGVLSNVLPHSPEAVECVIQGGVVQTICQLLKGRGPNAIKYGIKTLAVCTAASHLAREELVKSDKKLSTLRRLLATSCDDSVSGNAALCLAHCLELKGIASNLLGSDIVLLLLRHAAEDAKRTAVQKNSAIALGKLCQSEPRHVNKLRELHGIEILHSCMKLIT